MPCGCFNNNNKHNFTLNRFIRNRFASVLFIYDRQHIQYTIYDFCIIFFFCCSPHSSFQVHCVLLSISVASFVAYLFATMLINLLATCCFFPHLKNSSKCQSSYMVCVLFRVFFLFFFFFAFVTTFYFRSENLFT